jgi:hypothetical protein
MKKIYLTFLFAFVLLGASTAQKTVSDERVQDAVNLGIGLGQDYGGIGANIMVYPQRNIGIFFGGGYAFAGFGWNAGLKGRLISDEPHVATPFLLAMYGYNAAYAVSGNSSLNKIFYGPTFGVGLDLRSKKLSSRGFWSFAILVPIRSSEVDDYRRVLTDEYGVSLSPLIPIGISVGYKFILNN